MFANLVYIALKKQIDVDFYNTLSAIHYEKKVVSGGILIAKETQQCDLKINFEEKYPLEIKNVKQIRKLLEMATEGLFLVAKNGHIIGIGDDACSNERFDLFVFNGNQMWSYYESGQELLSYKEGKYTFIFDKKRNYIAQFPKNFINESNYFR